MSEKSGDRTLKIFGLAMLAVTGLATLLHSVHAIYRDLVGAKSKGDHGRGDRPQPQDTPRHAGTTTEENQPQGKDNGSERSWVRKARLAERKSEGEHARPEYRDRQGHAQQR